MTNKVDSIDQSIVFEVPNIPSVILRRTISFENVSIIHGFFYRMVPDTRVIFIQNFSNYQ